jgi:prolyl 4-hydroxylase
MTFINSAVVAAITLLHTAALTTASPNHDYEYNKLHQKTYGLDVSFPQHHTKISTNYDWLPHNDPKRSSPNHPNYASPPQEYKDMPLQILGNRQDFYDSFLEACRHHDHDACDESEKDRLEMNLRQPQSMVNYTTLGFEKVKVPKKVFNVLKKFWEANMGTEEVEEWNHGNTYTNHVSGRCVLVGYLFVAYDVIEY